LDNAGKTTILKKFNGEDISTIEPTLGFNIKTLEYLGFKLNCWDVGGQQTIRSYWRNYFEQTDGLIWVRIYQSMSVVERIDKCHSKVVDSSDRWRMEDCKRELHSLLGQEKLAGASLLIFANKQDLQGALTAAEIAVALDLSNDAVTSSRHWEIRGCSAVTGDGLFLTSGLFSTQPF
jgi:ADP-ribosylation factor-like protein 2